MICWCDSDWAACPNLRRLAKGYVIKCGSHEFPGNQRSNSPFPRALLRLVEYRTMASVVAEITWLLGLFKELEVFIKLLVFILSDSKSAMK